MFFRKKKKSEEKGEELLRVSVDTEEAKRRGLRGAIVSSLITTKNWIIYNPFKALLTFSISIVLILTIHYGSGSIPFFLYFYSFIAGVIVCYLYAEARRIKVCKLNIQGKEIYVDNTDVEETESGGEILYITDKFGQRYFSKNTKRRGSPATIYISPSVKAMLNTSVRGKESLTIPFAEIIATGNKYSDFAINLASSDKTEIILAQKVETLQTENSALKKQLEQARETIKEMSSDIYKYMEETIKEMVKIIWSVRRGDLSEEQLIEKKIEEVIGRYPAYGYGYPYRPYGSFGYPTWRREEPFLPHGYAQTKTEKEEEEGEL